MKKIWIFWGSFGVLAITVLVLVLLGILRDNQPTEQALNFCEAYPDAEFCVNADASDTDIALDMFNTLEANFPSGFDEEFCNAYFDGKVATYCSESVNMILPNDFSTLSHTVVMENISEGIYDVYTTYPNGNDAYLFRMAIVKKDGVFTISGLSYYNTPEPTDLNLTDEDVNAYMVSLIEAAGDDLPTFCLTYFTGDAYTACMNNEAPLVIPVIAIYNETLTKTDTNQYTYTFTNEDQTTSYEYHVSFVDDNGAIKLDSISLITN